MKLPVRRCKHCGLMIRQGNSRARLVTRLVWKAKDRSGRFSIVYCPYSSNLDHEPIGES